jgi:hypothetical protein
MLRKDILPGILWRHEGYDSFYLSISEEDAKILHSPVMSMGKYFCIRVGDGDTCTLFTEDNAECEIVNPVPASYHKYVEALLERLRARGISYQPLCPAQIERAIRRSDGC